MSGYLAGWMPSTIHQLSVLDDYPGDFSLVHHAFALGTCSDSGQGALDARG